MKGISVINNTVVSGAHKLLSFKPVGVCNPRKIFQGKKCVNAQKRYFFAYCVVYTTKCNTRGDGNWLHSIVSDARRRKF